MSRRVLGPAAFLYLTAVAIAPALAADTQGKDFIEEARRLHREVACGGADKPDNNHCKELTALYDRYRSKWVTPAMP